MLGRYALHGLSGKTESSHGSLVQFDRSFLSVLILVWNSLADITVDFLRHLEQRLSFREHDYLLY